MAMTDLEGKCFVRTERGLIPADIHADEWLATLPFKKEVVLTIRQPRNPKFLRWFFALLRKVMDNTDNHWKTVDQLREALTMSAGYYSIYQDMNGEYYRRPKSIATEAMKEHEFKIFVDRIKDQIAEHTGLDPDALMKEVDAEQGGSPFEGGAP